LDALEKLDPGDPGSIDSCEANQQAAMELYQQAASVLINQNWDLKWAYS
jgi:hypothetical protein